MGCVSVWFYGEAKATACQRCTEANRKKVHHCTGYRKANVQMYSSCILDGMLHLGTLLYITVRLTRHNGTPNQCIIAL